MAHVSLVVCLGGHLFVFGEYSLVLAINLLIVCLGDHIFVVVRFGDLSSCYLSW
jgi:hypothetical protein